MTITPVLAESDTSEISFTKVIHIEDDSVDAANVKKVNMMTVPDTLLKDYARLTHAIMHYRGLDLAKGPDLSLVYPAIITPQVKTEASGASPAERLEAVPLALVHTMWTCIMEQSYIQTGRNAVGTDGAGKYEVPPQPTDSKLQGETLQFDFLTIPKGTGVPLLDAIHTNDTARLIRGVKRRVLNGGYKLEEYHPVPIDEFAAHLQSHFDRDLKARYVNPDVIRRYYATFLPEGQSIRQTDWVPGRDKHIVSRRENHHMTDLALRAYPTLRPMVRQEMNTLVEGMLNITTLATLDVSRSLSSELSQNSQTSSAIGKVLDDMLRGANVESLFKECMVATLMSLHETLIPHPVADSKVAGLMTVIGWVCGKSLGIFNIFNMHPSSVAIMVNSFFHHFGPRLWQRWDQIEQSLQLGGQIIPGAASYSQFSEADYATTPSFLTAAFRGNWANVPQDVRSIIEGIAWMPGLPLGRAATAQELAYVDAIRDPNRDVPRMERDDGNAGAVAAGAVQGTYLYQRLTSVRNMSDAIGQVSLEQEALSNFTRALGDVLFARSPFTNQERTKLVAFLRNFKQVNKSTDYVRAHLNSIVQLSAVHSLHMQRPTPRTQNEYREVSPGWDTWRGQVYRDLGQVPAAGAAVPAQNNAVIDLTGVKPIDVQQGWAAYALSRVATRKEAGVDIIAPVQLPGTLEGTRARGEAAIVQIGWALTQYSISRRLLTGVPVYPRAAPAAIPQLAANLGVTDHVKFLGLIASDIGPLSMTDLVSALNGSQMHIIAFPRQGRVLVDAANRNNFVNLWDEYLDVAMQISSYHVMHNLPQFGYADAILVRPPGVVRGQGVFERVNWPVVASAVRPLTQAVRVDTQGNGFRNGSRYEFRTGPAVAVNDPRNLPAVDQQPTVNVPPGALNTRWAISAHEWAGLGEAARTELMSQGESGLIVGPVPVRIVVEPSGYSHTDPRDLTQVGSSHVPRTDFRILPRVVGIVPSASVRVEQFIPVGFQSLTRSTRLTMYYDAVPDMAAANLALNDTYNSRAFDEPVIGQARPAAAPANTVVRAARGAFTSIEAEYPVTAGAAPNLPLDHGHIPSEPFSAARTPSVVSIMRTDYAHRNPGVEVNITPVLA